MDKTLEEIVIRYKIDKKMLKIFGSKFVKNNKDKCKIIFDGKETELKEYIYIKNNIFKNLKKDKKKENSYE